MNKEVDVKFLKIQTCILKVNIHCDGCRQKVKKLLQKIDGVYTTTIDAEHGKVTVSGDVDPATLIKKLGKAGKRAELLYPKSPGNNDKLTDQLLKLHLDNGGKVGQKDAGKPQKVGSGGNNQKGPQPNPLEQLQQMKLLKNLNFVQSKDPKDPKSVKFELPEEDEEGSEFDDDDFDDDYEDEFDDLDDFDDGVEYDLPAIKAKAMAAGALPLENGMVSDKKGSGDGGGHNNSCKKGGGTDALGKGADPKNSNGGDKKGGGGGGNQNQAGSGKNGGGGGAAHEGGKNGGNNKTAASGNKNNGGGGGGGNKQVSGKGNGMPMSQQALMAQMAANMNMPTGCGVPAAVQGLPAGGLHPGYYPGGAITPEMISTANPYQQQYIAAMMQQQRMMMNSQDRSYQQMAYTRPPHTIGYMPPAPEFSHLFSDENTGSCRVM